MRLAKAIAIAGALAVMAAASASAAPLIPNPGPEQATNIVQVAGGCGRGAHPNRWGRGVPNHYGYYQPYWSRHYYAWRGPNDYRAKRLNPQPRGGHRRSSEAPPPPAPVRPAKFLRLPVFPSSVRSPQAQPHAQAVVAR